MLSDAALKALKPSPKTYKVADRDGMYVVVSPAGSVVFRLDYRLNGRRETLTIGKYGRDGISLADAREACVKARKTVKAGLSPAQQKQREKVRLKATQTFGDFAERWFAESPMADSTRSMRRSIYTRDLEGPWKKRLLSEISAHDLRALCHRIKERGAPATAVHRAWRSDP